MAMKIWTTQYAGILPDLFRSQSFFLRAFGGLQTLTNVEPDENFLRLKVSDTDVVIQNYSTDANVGFGTGTGSTSRFGTRKEVKSIDVQVPFDTPLAIHEGIDRFTVEDIPEQVVSERLALHGVAWAQRYDGVMSKTISDNADKTYLEPLTEAGVVKLFSDAHKHFVNEGVSAAIAWVAYVNTTVYDILNVSRQKLYHFKDFLLVEVPDAKFQTDEVAYFVADNVGVAGVGIQVARTIDSEDFAGVALQAAGKLGKYIPDKNKKAILKAARIKTGLKFVFADATGAGVPGVLVTVGTVEKYTDNDGVAVFATAAGSTAWTAELEGYDLDPAEGPTVAVANTIVEVLSTVAPTTTTTSQA